MSKHLSVCLNRSHHFQSLSKEGRTKTHAVLHHARVGEAHSSVRRWSASVNDSRYLQQGKKVLTFEAASRRVVGQTRTATADSFPLSTGNQAETEINGEVRDEESDDISTIDRKLLRLDYALHFRRIQRRLYFKAV